MDSREHRPLSVRAGLVVATAGRWVGVALSVLVPLLVTLAVLTGRLAARASVAVVNVVAARLAVTSRRSAWGSGRPH